MRQTVQLLLVGVLIDELEVDIVRHRSCDIDELRVYSGHDRGHQSGDHDRTQYRRESFEHDLEDDAGRVGIGEHRATVHTN